MSDVTFLRLLQARAIDELTPGEREQLDLLAAADPRRGAALAEWDVVHEVLADERALRQSLQPPVEPIEEAAQGFVRLQAAAARAGERLRSQMVAATLPRVVAAAPARRSWWLAAAALLVALSCWWLVGRGAAPALDPNVPQDRRAGGNLQLVLLEPVLTASARTIRWAPVAGAHGYGVVVVDADGNVVLSRDVTLQKSTAWELTPEQFASLRAQVRLALRVSALDGAGIAIGSSGDLALSLR
ncbi:MAG: hypothetical protein IPK26_28540 [Planctomycetes bacterium]|nr:hypothetical protein [Planctomycetota bacterium]